MGDLRPVRVWVFISMMGPGSGAGTPVLMASASQPGSRA